MLRLGFLILVLVAVLTQISQAVADVHQSHQSSSEQHLNFEHDESHIDKRNLPKSGEVSFDYHHCCHCHGSFHLYAMKAEKTLALPRMGTIRLGYTEFYTNPLSSPLFRPPISS